jgi:hypothetical protein
MTEGHEGLLAAAVFCPDWGTDAFAMLYLGGVRLCPNCNRPFEPNSGKMYCCDECGPAYRTAQSRKKQHRAEDAGKPPR